MPRILVVLIRLGAARVGCELRGVRFEGAWLALSSTLEHGRARSKGVLEGTGGMSNGGGRSFESHRRAGEHERMFEIQVPLVWHTCGEKGGLRAPVPARHLVSQQRCII